MANKEPSALTIGFDFVNSLLESCGGDYSDFGALLHAMFQYGEKRIEPDFEPGTACSILWPMAQIKTNQSLYAYTKRIRQNEVGGTKTQMKNRLKNLGASEELLEAFFLEPMWTRYAEDGTEPENGWLPILKEYLSANGIPGGNP